MLRFPRWALASSRIFSGLPPGEGAERPSREPELFVFGRALLQDFLYLVIRGSIVYSQPGSRCAGVIDLLASAKLPPCTSLSIFKGFFNVCLYNSSPISPPPTPSTLSQNEDV